MKPIKFWAETQEDAKNFLNYCEASGAFIDKNCWDYFINANALFCDNGGVTHQDNDRSYFDEKDCKEFFFPIPGDEFVEISELDGQIPNKESPKHSHYKKNVEHLKFIDVYRVLDLYEVTNSAIAHAVKKLLVAGGRGAGKDIAQDIDEAIDSLLRWKEMRDEDKQ